MMHTNSAPWTTEKALVSVVVPCFRCDETIARAVESVVGQTLPPAEILLIEDGSGDEGKTLDALYNLQSKYKNNNIKIIPLDRNGGASVARNRGWDEAMQPYIAFLDADDVWHPRKLEIQYKWMEVHPEVTFCGHLIKVVTSASDIGQSIDAISAHKIGRSEWLFSCRFSTISVMLRRNLPFRFTPGKCYAEDYLLWLRIALNGHDAWRLEVPLAFCFKQLYGSGGLTKDLWAVEKGELDAYSRIYQEELVRLASLTVMVLFSLLRYLRRVTLTFFRGK